MYPKQRFLHYKFKRRQKKGTRVAERLLGWKKMQRDVRFKKDYSSVPWVGVERRVDWAEGSCTSWTNMPHGDLSGKGEPTGEAYPFLESNLHVRGCGGEGRGAAVNCLRQQTRRLNRLEGFREGAWQAIDQRGGKQRGERARGKA